MASPFLSSPPRRAPRPAPMDALSPGSPGPALRVPPALRYRGSVPPFPARPPMPLYSAPVQPDLARGSAARPTVSFPARPPEAAAQDRAGPRSPSREEDEDHASTQVILLLMLSVLLLTLPWVVDHPATLLVPVALLLVPITSGAMRSIIGEGFALIGGGFRWFWTHRPPPTSQHSQPPPPQQQHPGAVRHANGVPPSHAHAHAPPHPAAHGAHPPHVYPHAPHAHADRHVGVAYNAHDTWRSPSPTEQRRPALAPQPQGRALSPARQALPPRERQAAPLHHPHAHVHGPPPPPPPVGPAPSGYPSIVAHGPFCYLPGPQPDLAAAHMWSRADVDSDFESDVEAHVDHPRPHLHSKPPRALHVGTRHHTRLNDDTECVLENWDSPDCSSRVGHAPLSELLSNGQ